MAVSLDGFTAFLRDVVGIDTTVLPVDSPYIALAYNVAIENVYYVIAQIAPYSYEAAVYNFATNFLINVCPDQTGQTYFADLRAKFNLLKFTVGPIITTFDDGTGETMFVPDFYKNMNLAELQLLKTPWGIAYLSIAQQTGLLWGIT